MHAQLKLAQGHLAPPNGRWDTIVARFAGTTGATSEQVSAMAESFILCMIGEVIEDPDPSQVHN
jgi:hypothetical protein